MEPSKKYNWKGLRELVKQKLENEKTGHDYEHIIRVYDSAFELAKSVDEPVDYDVLAAACLLHDISLESGPDKKHHLTSAERAVPILHTFGFDDKTTIKISEAIRHHHDKDNNEEISVEARLLLEADKKALS